MTEFDEKYPDPSYKSGWNPYQPFYPKDDFSKGMLKTIMTKVSKWLQNMDQDSSGEWGELGWNFTPDGGTLVYANTSKDRFIQLWWDIDSDQTTMCGSDKRFEDVAHDMDFFVAVEQAIYNELEGLQLTLGGTLPQLVIEEKSAFDLDLAAAERNGRSS